MGVLSVPLLHHYHPIEALKLNPIPIRFQPKHPLIRPPPCKIIRCSKQIPNNDLLMQTLSQNKLGLMLRYADNGLFNEAHSIWDEIINSSHMPNVILISKIIDKYCEIGRYEQAMRIIQQLSLRDSKLLPDIYRVALSCFGNRGQLEMMGNILRDMVSRGFSLDFSTGNDIIMYYSLYGSVAEMEDVYSLLKKWRIVIREDAIRAISLAYIKRNKFYNLGEFIRELGLNRRDVGNLLWNLLLLSYAANFKMKSLQKEFLRMVESGFEPDITTFNIRAIAFSKMSLFWDLHLSFEHMRHNKIVPDLVTYGCVVDAYLERRLGKNLEFALSKMNVNNSPVVSTDPIIFEVLGKGDFHASSEAFLEFQRWEILTYKDLIAIYVKKKYRSNQIFWNY